MPTYVALMIVLLIAEPVLFLLFGFRAGVRVGMRKGYQNGRTAAILGLAPAYAAKITRSSTYGKKVRP